MLNEWVRFATFSGLITALHNFESECRFVAAKGTHATGKCAADAMRRLSARGAHACVARATQHVRVPAMFEARFQSFDDANVAQRGDVGAVTDAK